MSTTQLTPEAAALNLIATAREIKAELAKGGMDCGKSMYAVCNSFAKRFSISLDMATTIFELA